MLMEQTLIEDLELQRQKMAGLAYRNGYYPRSLVTQFRLIQDLQVPRLREDSFPTPGRRFNSKHFPGRGGLHPPGR